VEVLEADRERCMGGLIALAVSALTLMDTLLRDNARAGNALGVQPQELMKGD
jgi:hypothetical protein